MAYLISETTKEEREQIVTLIFLALMVMVFGKLIILAIKAAWGITKILVTIVFFPVILIGMACTGLIYLAIAILVIGGIVGLVRMILD